MEPKRNKPPKCLKRRRASVAIAALVLAMTSCGRHDEGPLPPHSPPRPTMAYGADLMHAHFQLPAKPTPPRRGMM